MNLYDPYVFIIISEIVPWQSLEMTVFSVNESCKQEGVKIRALSVMPYFGSCF